ncbi:MAG: MASE3 domain-containing protein [Sideroxydans sp.]|nr:MASE3 domain-containing protein [Sideroxydans sp.]
MIHSVYRMPLLDVGKFLILLAAIQLLAWLVPSLPEFKGIPNYLPLHTLLETVSIIVSMMVFAVGWNSHSQKLSGNIVLLASVFFSVAVLDFSHTVSYLGMPDFISPNDAQKQLNFWLSARFIAAFVLLLVAIRPWKPLKSNTTRHLIFISFICFALFMNWAVVYHQAWMPDTFIPGKGLTAFKKAVEYAIIVINIVTAIALWKKMREPQSFNVVLLFAAVCTLAMSEFFFTLYTTMTGSYNVLGHIYKVIAYLFIYRAIVVELIEEPYNQLAEAQKKLSISLQASNTGLWDWDLDTHQVFFSPEWKAQLGYAPEELPNQFATWEGLLHPEDKEFALSRVNNYLASDSRQYVSEFRLRHRDGSYRWILARGEKQYDEKGRVELLVGSHIDITERKNAEAEIHNLAFFDSLTRLPNRRLLIDRMHFALANSLRSKLYGAVLFLDMDKFKTINDTLGHDYGDLLLIEVSERILFCVRDSDTVARLGGDEFVVLLEGLDAEPEEASRKAALIAEKIRVALVHSYVLHEHEQHSSPSIGVCIFQGVEDSVESLLKHADIAMYQVKDAGRNAVRFFDMEMQSRVETRAALESDLRSAVVAQQLELHYQIQVDFERRAIGVEALVRWPHTQRGMVPPLQFIPVAEESSLIVDIGDWVLDTACRQLHEWAKHDRTRHLSMAVNVSARQFKEHDFVAKIESLLRVYEIEASLLKLELTESVVLSNVTDVIAKMHALKGLGVSLSLDDFGTGYSSLSYLKQLPLDQIKIDQSFIHDLTIDTNDAVMVQTIIGLADNFRLNLIAEGVETEAQFRFLTEHGCAAYQGYLFSKPLPIEEFEKLLERY